MKTVTGASGRPGVHAAPRARRDLEVETGRVIHHLLHVEARIARTYIGRSNASMQKLAINNMKVSKKML